MLKGNRRNGKVGAEEKLFPKLMIAKDSTEGIVLFSSSGTGIIVNPGTDMAGLGHFSIDWGMDYFEDLPKDIVIELSNE